MSDSNSELENLLETGAHIWLRERDRDPLPCTILRQVFHDNILEYAAPFLAGRVIPPAKQTNTPPFDHD